MKVKRILSALLTLSLLLSCICIFASAESEAYTGVYNGYSYYCYGNLTRSKCYVEMKYNNSTPKIALKGSYTYVDTNGRQQAKDYYASGKANTFKTNLPELLDHYVSLRAEYYIGTERVVYLPLSAS